MQFVWRKAARGLYHIRDHHGLGPSCGRVASVHEPGGGSFYRADFTYGNVGITFRAGGMPKNVIAQLEADIRRFLPDAEFLHKDF